jgi:hypothetical protein
MAKLRWGFKTAPQHTIYDAMLTVWQEADRTPVGAAMVVDGGQTV